MASKTNSPTNKIKFNLFAETKGAVRYQEVDDAGTPVEGDDAHIGSLYFRKANFGKISATWASTGEPPPGLTVTIETV